MKQEDLSRRSIILLSVKLCLQWSDQPIYTLEKHHLPIRELAIVNAKDILLVQPEGPYLLGGHSYGGTVAVEIAMVLEAWGHDVEAVIVMDTPMKEQSLIVPDPDRKVATDDDLNDVMEMLIGALGAETVGLGKGRQHPKDSEEWKRMTVSFRFDNLIMKIFQEKNCSWVFIRKIMICIRNFHLLYCSLKNASSS